MKLNEQLPIAKKGEELKAPANVTATFNKATSRTMKVQSPEGEVEQPIIVLEFEDVPNVIRTVPQAKGDLIDFYPKEVLENITPTLAVASYNRYFRGKSVSFKGSYHEEGAIQTVDENSKLYVNGLQEIGAKVETQTAGVWIEGFMSVRLSDAELDAIIERELNAMAKVSQAEADLVP